MILPDVNILIYAHREGMPDHNFYRELVEGWIAGDAAYGVADIVLSSFLRIVTNPKTFSRPSTMDEALSFLDPVRNAPNCVRIEPGPRHWDIFIRLCRETNASGNLVPDAYLAALAIESGSEWITTDGDTAGFPACTGATHSGRSRRACAHSASQGDIG